MESLIVWIKRKIVRFEWKVYKFMKVCE